MNRGQHYQKAEELLAEVADLSPERRLDNPQDRLEYLSAALVHATLASVSSAAEYDAMLPPRRGGR